MLKQEYAKQLEHLVKLAKQDGWKPYAWHRAKELDFPGSPYEGISEELKQKMKGEK